MWALSVCRWCGCELQRSVKCCTAACWLAGWNVAHVQWHNLLLARFYFSRYWTAVSRKESQQRLCLIFNLICFLKKATTVSSNDSSCDSVRSKEWHWTPESLRIKRTFIKIQETQQERAYKQTISNNDGSNIFKNNNNDNNGKETRSLCLCLRMRPVLVQIQRKEKTNKLTNPWKTKTQQTALKDMWHIQRGTPHFSYHWDYYYYYFSYKI